MKSDNTSKYTEERATVIISDTNTIYSPQPGNIIFKFSDGTISEYDINSISIINPLLFSNIDKNGNYEIILPNYINKSNLMDFLFIVKNGIGELEDYSLNNTNKFLNLIRISEYFKNEKTSVLIINQIIIKKVNEDNAFDFLDFSYERLNTTSNEELDNCYFELFYRCLEIIGNNEHLFLKNIDRIKHLDKKVIDELLQKTFSHLVYGNYIYIERDSDDNSSNDIEPENNFETIQDETNNNNNQVKKKNTNFISMRNLNDLISCLYEIYGTNNFFKLLTLEYMSLFSQESLSELNNAPNPTFHMKINLNDITNYYEEFPINFSINNKTIVFIIFYKISDDSLNVCMKFSNNKKKNDNNNVNNIIMPPIEENFYFNIFTFLSIVKLSRGNNTKPLSSQTNLKCLNNNKSMHSIFKIANFTSAMNKSVYQDNQSFVNETYNYNNNNNEEYFNISINLKLCYIHSVLSSYLLRNYSKLCDEPDIHKISKQLLILIIKNKFLNKNDENDIVIGINKWLDDEINIKEDITELFDVIQWDKVKDEYIFELMIKYSNMIVGNENVENIFIKAFQDKYNNNPYIKEIIKSLFKATSVINYSSLFTLMKKNEKFNLAYFNNNVHGTKINNNNLSISSNQNTNNTNNTNNSNILEKIKEKQKKLLNNNFNEKTKTNKLNTTSKKEKTTKKILKYPPTPSESNKVINYVLNNNNQKNKNTSSLNKSIYNNHNNDKNSLISKIKKTRNNNNNSYYEDSHHIPKEIYISDNSFNKQTRMINNNIYKIHSNKNSSEHNNYNNLKTAHSINNKIHKRNNSQLISDNENKNNISINSKHNKLYRKKK